MSDTNEREDFEKFSLKEQIFTEGDLAYDTPEIKRAFKFWQAATSTSNARYQSRIKELEEALRKIAERYVSLVDCGDCGNWDARSEPQVIAAYKALSATTPDTALQKALLKAEIKGRIDTEDESSWGRATRTVELRAQLASLNRNEPLGE